jgi:hypothetical protein
LYYKYVCDVYYKYVKEGDKHNSDLKYLGLMFFIAGTGLGMAPQFRDGTYPTPIHQYHLFNIPSRHAICAGEVVYEPNPVKPKLVRCIYSVYRVNIAEKGVKPASMESVQQGNSPSSPGVTMKNPPDPSPIDAPDASSSVTSTMEPTSKATLDPKARELTETQQHEILKTLMNYPQLSPSGGIAGMVITDHSMTMGNVSLESQFEEEEDKPE